MRTATLQPQFRHTDPIIAASMARKLFVPCGLFWWAGSESNTRHKDFQSFALPTELPAHRV
jgi:hypothetical protein